MCHFNISILFTYILGCEYSKWSEWTSCSKECGNGYRERNRNKLFKKGNENCNQPESEIEDCNTDICESKFL